MTRDVSQGVNADLPQTTVHRTASPKRGSRRRCNVVCKVGRKLLFQLIVQHGGVSVLHAGVIVLVGGVVVLHGGLGVLTQYLLHAAREGHGTQTRLDHDSLN